MLTERRDDGSVWISHGRRNGKLTSKSRNRWFLTIGCVWTKTNNCTNDNSYDPYCWHRHDLIKPSPLTGNRPFLGPSCDDISLFDADRKWSKVEPHFWLFMVDFSLFDFCVWLLILALVGKTMEKVKSDQFCCVVLCCVIRGAAYARGVSLHITV